MRLAGRDLCSPHVNPGSHTYGLGADRGTNSSEEQEEQVLITHREQSQESAAGAPHSFTTIQPLSVRNQDWSSQATSGQVSWQTWIHKNQSWLSSRFSFTIQLLPMALQRVTGSGTTSCLTLDFHSSSNYTFAHQLLEVQSCTQTFTSGLLL